MWLTGWLLTAGQLDTSPAGAASVAVQLLANSADPAAAWPEVDRVRLPGPIVFYGPLLGLLLVPTTIGSVLSGCAGANGGTEGQRTRPGRPGVTSRRCGCGNWSETG